MIKSCTSHSSLVVLKCKTTFITAFSLKWLDCTLCSEFSPFFHNGSNLRRSELRKAEGLMVLLRHPDIKERVVKNYFSYFSTKIYVVGPQKNRLNETVLLSTQNRFLN